ncbi:hypothetical protein BV898_19680 [Hypsibius exemplaris]|uniref:Uncharacterized protein n=1 Tax=Hypsibius exemplaris TaxID=2072580 RepID=A0A9X6RPP0_HYPEX|nr:hypothetical protein BV898_19680 [Hypsibius exemplaris]
MAKANLDLRCKDAKDLHRSPGISQYRGPLHDVAYIASPPGYECSKQLVAAHLSRHHCLTRIILARSAMANLIIVPLELFDWSQSHKQKLREFFDDQKRRRFAGTK